MGPTLTANTDSVIRHVALELAQEMRRTGTPRRARVLEASALRTFQDAEPLPPGVVIPPDVYKDVRESLQALVARLEAEIGVLAEREH